MCCKEAFSRLDDYLDRQLTELEIVMVEEHLALCAGCAKEFHFEAKCLEQMKAKLRRIDLPSHLHDSVFAKIRALEQTP